MYNNVVACRSAAGARPSIGNNVVAGKNSKLLTKITGIVNFVIILQICRWSKTRCCPPTRGASQPTCSACGGAPGRRPRAAT